MIGDWVVKSKKYSTFSYFLSVGTCAAEPQNPRYKFALYGATKSYNHILSSGLEECYGDKIDVMTVIPRQTKTKMNPADYLFTVSMILTNMYGFWDGKIKRRIIFNTSTTGYNWGTCQSCCGQDWLGQQDVWNPDSSPWVQHEVHIRSIWNLRQVRSMVQQESEWKNDQDLRIGQQEDVKSSILIYAWFILILTLFSFSLSLWTYNIIKE